MEWLRQWQAELPKFQTPMDLRKNSGWKRYLGHVYGQDTLSFPIDLRLFSFFYQEILPSNDKKMTCARPLLAAPFAITNPEDPRARRAAWIDAVRVRRKQAQSCRRPGDVYTLNGGLCYNSSLGTAVWVYRWDHPAVALHEFPATPELSYGLMSAVEPHKKVEVYHCRDNIGRSAPYFMYRADGSGIYYDVGKTKVFHDQHKTGWTYTETYNFYSFWREKGFDSARGDEAPAHHPSSACGARPVPPGT